jgi:DNA-binding NarL/FixJ family response regulator
MTPVLRVVLAEDNFLALTAITTVLERLEGIELVAAYRDTDTLLRELDRTSPDVVITDIRLPPTETDEGIRLADMLRTTHPTMGVVVLSQHVEPLYATALFAAGSHHRAYLLKERVRDASELDRAIHEVARGGALVDPRVVDELLTTWERRDDSPIRSLTPRELEVLGLIAEGYANNAIAERLAISKRGVERHVNGILAKLGLHESDDVSRRVMAAILFLTGEGTLPPNAHEWAAPVRSVQPPQPFH